MREKQVGRITFSPKVIVKVIHCKNKKCKNLDSSGVCGCVDTITITVDGKCSKEIK